MDNIPSEHIRPELRRTIRWHAVNMMLAASYSGILSLFLVYMTRRLGTPREIFFQVVPFAAIACLLSVQWWRLLLARRRMVDHVVRLLREEQGRKMRVRLMKLSHHSGWVVELIEPGGQPPNEPSRLVLLFFNLRTLRMSWDAWPATVYLDPLGKAVAVDGGKGRLYWGIPLCRRDVDTNFRWKLLFATCIGMGLLGISLPMVLDTTPLDEARRGMAEARASESWPKTKGRILAMSLDEGAANAECPECQRTCEGMQIHMTYAYNVDGRTVSAHRLRACSPP